MSLSHALRHLLGESQRARQSIEQSRRNRPASSAVSQSRGQSYGWSRVEAPEGRPSHSAGLMIRGKASRSALFRPILLQVALARCGPAVASTVRHCVPRQVSLLPLSVDARPPSRAKSAGAGSWRGAVGLQRR